MRASARSSSGSAAARRPTAASACSRALGCDRHDGDAARSTSTEARPTTGRLSTSQVACDVTNPLLGPDGRGRDYGPQKGATPSQVAELDAPTRRIGRIASRRATGRRERDTPGAGAAGGVGFAPAGDPGPVPLVRAATRGRPRDGGDRLRRPPRRGRPRHHRRGPDRRPDRVRQDGPRAWRGVPRLPASRASRSVAASSRKASRPSPRSAPSRSRSSSARCRSRRRWPAGTEPLERCGERLARLVSSA